MTFKWIAESRVVPVLRRVLNPGDEFEAEPRVGTALVAQKLAVRSFEAYAEEHGITDELAERLRELAAGDDQWSDDEP